MGKLALRIGADCPDFEVVHVNDPGGDPATLAHLLEFDSVHGRWPREIRASDDSIFVDGREITVSRGSAPAEFIWSKPGVDLVLECSGRFKTAEALAPYFAAGVRKVLVSAPCADPAINLVMGVNHDLYDSASHNIVTAASCTTNCLAPLVAVIQQSVGIRHGSITTIHDITNTQTILDRPHKDLRRARACGTSLIPTSTGSARAIIQIFPELAGRLDGIAVRVPLANASITDFTFEAERATSIEEINRLFSEAAVSQYQGILGVEERPLVSVDYLGDSRSAIVDLSCTNVIDQTQVKILAWYDNEWGYVNRMVELTQLISRQL